MTHEEYINEQVNIGYNIHQHDGVWWLKVSPFFCKPVNPLQVIEPGKAKPYFLKSFLGYSHLVSDNVPSNKNWSVLMLNKDKLEDFSIKSLSSSKRAQVRKGLRLTEVKIIEDIESVMDDMKGICISMSMRTGYGKPANYFADHYEEWKASLIKQCTISSKERWGSFYNGSLIAFMNIEQIDHTVIVTNAQSHTEHLDKCPNDALIFSIMEHCKTLGNCQNIIFGDWSDVPSLNTFKQKYGYYKYDFPVYVKYNFLVPITKKIKQFYSKFRNK